MSKIITLDENTINKIAAGEVVERPASVIKELAENSIDAGATRITIEIKKGGISYIRISDNGSGIEEDDIQLAFERHSTSKIRHSDELSSILTMGFRGEALSSIASVSKVEMITKTQEMDHGVKVNVIGGNVESVSQIGAPVGTSITVRDIFFNTPARYKFLKRDSTESGYISDIVNRMALGNTNVAFKFINNGATIIQTPGNNDLLSTIVSIYGSSVSNHLSEIGYQEGFIKLEGYLGSPEIARANRNHQSFFINNRYIKSKLITAAIEDAYKTVLMKNKFPFIVLKMNINTEEVDINVHPAKMEVRFSNENEVSRIIYNALYGTLMEIGAISEYIDKKSDGPTDIQTKNTNAKSNINSNMESSMKSNIDSSVISSPKANANCNKNSNIVAERQMSFVVEDDEIWSATPKPNNKTSTLVDTVSSTEDIVNSNTDSDIDADTKAGTIIDNQATPINEVTSPSKINDLKGAIFIGQAFSTYIFMQKNENMFIIDQHAAHERVLFEKLQEKYSKNENISQILLAPIVIELTFQELQLTTENKELFEKLGFIYEDFGNNSIILRSIPYKEQKGEEKELFLHLLDCITQYAGKPGNVLEEEALYQIACKAAVKANMKLDDMEKLELVKELLKLNNPYTCPHGRPTIIKMSKNELEKMFKRKV